MTKFNTPTTTKTKNFEGGDAYSVSHEEELYLLACSSFLEDKFYEKASTQLQRIKDLVPKCNPQFVANLTIYVREKMNLRSITHVLAVELARSHKGLAKRVIERICVRADDMTEILAYQINQYGKPIPAQIKKGLAAAFGKFNEYKLAKYNRDGAVKLKDVLFLSHAPRTELTDKVVNDTLAVPNTWEVRLSGSKGENKAAIWKELVLSGEIGYMALIRNLRNILAECDGETIEIICNRIQDKDQVANSRQLPFRFYSAYRELKGVTSPYTGRVMEALEKACELSATNLPITGTSLITSDVSGSMETSLSSKSKVRLIDIGLVMSGVLKGIAPNSITSIFGDEFKIKNFTGCFGLANSYREGEVGYSTHGYLAVDYLNKKKIKVDNIFFFTDTQMYGGSLQAEIDKYKKNINHNVRVYIFTLGGYPEVAARGGNIYSISGWSEGVFAYIDAISQSKDVLQSIREYK